MGSFAVLLFAVGNYRREPYSLAHGMSNYRRRW